MRRPCGSRTRSSSSEAFTFSASCLPVGANATRRPRITGASSNTGATAISTATRSPTRARSLRGRRGGMWIFIIGVGILALAHTAPVPFLLDAFAGRRAVWHMPRTDPPTIYLTFDDGPNPTTTPDLLDVLAREGVHATFFLIDRHITDETAPIVRRIFDDGHAVALHSGTRALMLMSPDRFALTLTEAAD